MSRIEQPKTVINADFATSFKGAFVLGDPYISGDTVTDSGSTYIAIQPSTGVALTDTQYWAIVADGAYSLAVSGGYTGTESDFITDLASIEGIAEAIDLIMNGSVPE